MTEPSLASIIDHTLLKPDATSDQIDTLCHEALTYQFASVCVNPVWVAQCAERLRGSRVRVCTVVGFPLGATTTAVKATETEDAVQNGAAEIDVVLNIGWLKSGFFERVAADITEVVRAAGTSVPVKVILETGLLTDEEKKTACRISREAGAAFVKTSTGFAGSGATVRDIRLMREAVGPRMGVKASGGIRDYDTAIAMVHAGASRIGSSSSVAIIRQK
ncbi:deoxyribose-phosphate aldolase [Novibacillus thermophilus]|jgi:deoxyribose-phosphate aldolase|uniref:Deoxyribose-phosphate aldolase n=1 Tax=Novibacillus thermophilus TaxID=1471761 RepID=A0A1U9K5L5_9BACL|nr:deoxyribose-phosphate aldolase [Novibacillus thermophilus]AQS55349.1 deoxyribose-phosphate aldolase [Novibacillus thermophilus]